MSRLHKAITRRGRYPLPARPVRDRGARPRPPRGRTPGHAPRGTSAGEERLMHDHGGRAGPARPPRRRWRLAALAGVLALALAVAACGGGHKADGVASLSGASKATTTTTAPLSKQDAQRAA